MIQNVFIILIYTDIFMIFDLCDVSYCIQFLTRVHGGGCDP